MTVYKSPECGYTIEGGHIVTDGTVKHKITGTNMAGILGCSPWSTPFQVACDLLGLGREDLDDKPAVKTGKALEGRIIDYVAREKADVAMFESAEKVFEKREGDHDSWKSDFEDDIFAGHVDGIAFMPDGSTRVLEIKTSRNLESWENGVPEYYYWQVALYNEFVAKADSAYVVLGMVDENTYRDPAGWVPSSINTAFFDMPFDRGKVSQGIADAKRFYEEFIVKGCTPDYDPTNPKDLELFNHLKNLASSVEEMQSKVQIMAELNEQISARSGEIKDLEAARDVLKSDLKDYLSVHGLKDLRAPDGAVRAVLGVQRRTHISAEKLKADGIDPEKYIETNIITILSLKK